MVGIKNADNLIAQLEKMKEENEVDGFKIYFQNKNEVCIKGIKEEKIVCVYRKRTRRLKAWDIKEK